MNLLTAKPLESDQPLPRFFLWAILGAGLLVSLALYVHRLMTNGDNLDYLYIAWQTMTQDGLHPFKWRFPVGYPYLLSLWFWMTGQQPSCDLFTLSSAAVASAKMLGVCLVIPSFVAVLFWLRQVKAPFPFLLGLLLATSQVLMIQFSIIGAEPLFICCSLLALVLWERLAQQETPSLKLWLAASVFTLAAIQARQIGMAIPVAALSYVFLNRKQHSAAWRRSAYAAALSPLVLSLMVAVFTNPTYLVYFFANPEAVEVPRPSFLEILSGSLAAYRWTFPSVIVPKCFGVSGMLQLLSMPFLSAPLALFLYAILAVGVGKVFGVARTEGQISSLYCVVSVLVFLVCPYRDNRYFAPLLPVLLWLTLLGLLQIGQGWRFRSVNPIAFLLLAWIGFQVATDAFAARKNLQLIWRLRELPPWHPERYVPTSELDFAGLLDAGTWIGAHSPSNSRVVSSKALFVQISARRPAEYPRGLEKAMRQSRENATPLYVVRDSFPESASYGRAKITDLLPRLRQEKSRFALVYTSPYLETRVYRYLDGDASLP